MQKLYKWEAVASFGIHIHVHSLPVVIAVLEGAHVI
jgi:hypothetical protein